VWQTSRSIGTASSDADGRYSIQWQAPTARVGPAQIKSVLIVRDPVRNFVATRELDETNTRLDLRLREGLSLFGLVQDPGGKPLAGVEVRLVMPVNNWESALDRTLTDAQGAFNFKGLPQGEDCSLYVNMPASTARVGGFTIAGSAIIARTNPAPSSGVGTGGYGVARATLAAKDTRTDHYAFPAFVLRKADRKVAGHVLDADNKPMAGAMLSLSGEGQPRLPSVTTDQQGRFAVDGLCEGPLKISVVTIRVGAGGGVTPATLNAVNGQDIRAGDTNLVLKPGDKPPDTNAPQPAF
jgi:5-hydroxyisourate hydrolase-like protein (transthyretin family)